IEMPYATPHNFAGVALYSVARCLLRRDVAERLVRVERRLGAEGLGLLVWDCYRPFRVQQRLWALVPDARYVAEPVVRDGRPVEGAPRCSTARSPSGPRAGGARRPLRPGRAWPRRRAAAAPPPPHPPPPIRARWPRCRRGTAARYRGPRWVGL